MPSFNPKIFTDPGSLRRIAPELLIRFLQQWSAYFAKRGLDLNKVAMDDPPIDDIARVLREPDASVPEDMVNALYYVHETASHEDMEEMLALAAKESVIVEHAGAVSTADIAVQIWLAKPSLLERQYAESLALSRTNFIYFAGATKRSGEAVIAISEEVRTAIQASMDEWFERNRRARGTRIFAFNRGQKTWLMVRHGMPLRREGKHRDDGETGVALYRPQHHDVLIYDGQANEIGVNASTKGQRTLYLKVFGEALFGSESYFDQSKRYTLDPLRDRGPHCVACEDIEGVSRVRLVEIGRSWGGKTGEREIRKSEDLFETFGANWEKRLTGGQFTHAIFRFSFVGDKKQRSVTIRPENIARYDREADEEIVEAWLKARGFWIEANGDDNGADT